MKSERRNFDGHSLTEQPDGSAVLIVETRDGKKKQTLAIHLAPHVYADLVFLFAQRSGAARVANAKTQNDERRKAEVRVSRG